MGRVTGVGGIFFKAENPEALYAWYEKHLGIKREQWGVIVPLAGRWRSGGMHGVVHFSEKVGVFWSRRAEFHDQLPG